MSWVAPFYTTHSIKKYNVSLLKLYFSDEMSQEVAGKNPSRNPNQHHKLDCTPEAEEKPNGNLESKM